MRIKDPRPEIQRLEELVVAIRNGEIRLPKFQRPFVWTRKDIIKLFDSIYKGYPIGSILLWHSSERLMSEREIIGFKLNKTDNIESFPTNYLLDGQQRLTSLCASLYNVNPNPKSLWNVHFDLENEIFYYPKEGTTNLSFPMNKLLSTSDFIKQCMRFESLENSDRYYKIAEQLLKSFKDYKLAVVKIGDVTLEEVSPIFERINSTGRKLTMVDLMRAATWQDGFDLSDAISNLKKSIDSSFGEISEPHILRSISASCNYGVNKADIDKLRNKNSIELKTAFDETIEAINKTIDFSRKVLNIEILDYFPYSMQFTMLVEFFRVNKIIDNYKNVLIKWFWSTSINRYFSGANTGQITKDLNAIRLFASERSITFPQEIIHTDLENFFLETFNLRNVSSKTFLLIIKKSYYLYNNYDFNNEKINRDYFVDLFNKHNPFYNLNISKILLPNGNNEIPEDKSEISKINFLEDDKNPSEDYDELIEKRMHKCHEFINQLTKLEI